MPTKCQQARREIKRQRSLITALLAREIEQADPSDSLDFQSEWAGYLCVRLSGAFDVCMHEIFTAYVEDYPSRGRLGTFVVGELSRQKGRRFWNMNTEKMLNLIGEFDDQWKDTIKASLSSDSMAAVGGIVFDRNRIAHGVDVSMSLEEMRKAPDLVFEVVEVVAAECGV